MLIITVSSRGMLWKRERGKKENGFFSMKSIQTIQLNDSLFFVV